MSMNELESRVNELRELRRMAEELDAEIAALEDSLKAATKEDAAVSADLNLDRQVLDIVIKL